MKKIYIRAYCKQNLGDDLFIQTLVRRYPEAVFYLFADPKYLTSFLGESNLKVTSFVEYFVFRMFRKFHLVTMESVHHFFHKRCDAEVHIGGSVFIEPLTWESQAIRCQKLDCADFYIGTNFGPYRSPSFLDTVKSKVAHAKDCCFRDRYSYDLFKGMQNTRYAPDVLFGYHYFPKRKKGNGLGISVISLENRANLSKMKEVYYRTIAEACDICASRGFPVSLFSFCKEEGDEKAIASILKYAEHKERVRVCKYHGDISAFLNDMNSCECIAATRFHAMILGWAMKKKVLPILYSKKQATVIADIDYRGPVWNLMDEQTYAADRLVSDCFENEIQNMANSVELSEKQFAALDDYMRDKGKC